MRICTHTFLSIPERRANLYTLWQIGDFLLITYHKKIVIYMFFGIIKEKEISE